MTDALLDAVLADPDDDTARLVYADWLMENGDPDRGEYIVLSCELARSPSGAQDSPERAERAASLLAANEQRWSEELGVAGFIRLDFIRGFPESAELRVSKAAPATLAALVARIPLRELTVSNAGPLGYDELGSFVALPVLRQLHTLRMRGMRLNARRVRALLAPGSCIESLRVLDLSHAKLTRSGAAALASGRETDLEELDLEGAWLDDDTAMPGRLAPMFESRAFRRLRTLRAVRCTDSFAAISLAARGGWPSLTSLSASLSISHASDTALSELAEASVVTQLRALELDGGPADPTTLRAILRLVARTRCLEELSLRRMILGDEGVAFLAACEGLTSLRRLVIPDAGVTDRGLRALAASRWLQSLRYLDAAGVGLRIHPDTTNALRQRFGQLVLHC